MRGNAGTVALPVLAQPMAVAWGPAAETTLAGRVTFTVAVAELANESTTWRTSVTPPIGPAW